MQEKAILLVQEQIIANLAYVNLNFNENVFYISYCNKDQFRQLLEVNLMYFGKEV